MPMSLSGWEKHSQRHRHWYLNVVCEESLSLPHPAQTALFFSFFFNETIFSFSGQLSCCLEDFAKPTTNKTSQLVFIFTRGEHSFKKRPFFLPWDFFLVLLETRSTNKLERIQILIFVTLPALSRYITTSLPYSFSRQHKFRCS